MRDLRTESPVKSWVLAPREVLVQLMQLVLSSTLYTSLARVPLYLVTQVLRGLRAIILSIAASVKSNPHSWTVVAVSSGIIVWFFRVFYTAGLTMTFHDGTAKLTMARRVFDNAQGYFSLAQFGGVWLPLMSALELTTVWINPFYQTGFSGSLVAMVSFVLLTVLVFDYVRTATGKLVGGYTAAAIALFGSMNLVYFGTSTMAETLLMALMALCALSLLRIELTIMRGEEPLKWLVISNIAFMLICMTRYEGFFLSGFATAVLAVTLWIHRIRGMRLIAYTGTFAIVPVCTIICWLVYELSIFGNAFFFATSQYSANKIDVIGWGFDDAVGSIQGTVHNYLYAVRWNYSDLLLALTLASCAVYAVRLVLKREKKVSPVFLAGIPLFYMASLYRGQIAIDPDPVSPYNVRYGLPVGVFIAIAIGYLMSMVVSTPVRKSVWPNYTFIAVMAITLAYPVGSAMADPLASATILQEDAAHDPASTKEIAQCLRNSYQGGRVLLESWHSAALQFESHLDLGEFITEASPELFQVALHNPSDNVDWVYVGSNPTEQVGKAMEIVPDFNTTYSIVFQEGTETLYLKNDRIYGPASEVCNATN